MSDADEVREYTSTASATRASWSPATDASSAPHKYRNSRTRSGANSPIFVSPAIAPPNLRTTEIAPNSPPRRSTVSASSQVMDP
ncbi:hypothetical protein JCM33774_45740 [Actinophytocola sp. KF-1]